MFPSDIMHLILNLAELLMKLWRGMFDCPKTDSKSSWVWAVLDGKDDRWVRHSEHVAAATLYLPGSFDQPSIIPLKRSTVATKPGNFFSISLVLDLLFCTIFFPMHIGDTSAS